MTSNTGVSADGGGQHVIHPNLSQTNALGSSGKYTGGLDEKAMNSRQGSASQAIVWIFPLKKTMSDLVLI